MRVSRGLAALERAVFRCYPILDVLVNGGYGGGGGDG